MHVNEQVWQHHLGPCLGPPLVLQVVPGFSHVPLSLLTWKLFNILHIYFKAIKFLGNSPYPNVFSPAGYQFAELQWCLRTLM